LSSNCLFTDEYREMYHFPNIKMNLMKRTDKRIV